MTKTMEDRQDKGPYEPKRGSHIQIYCTVYGERKVSNAVESSDEYICSTRRQVVVVAALHKAADSPLLQLLMLMSLMSS